MLASNLIFIRVSKLSYVEYIWGFVSTNYRLATFGLVTDCGMSSAKANWPMWVSNKQHVWQTQVVRFTNNVQHNLEVMKSK